MSVVIDPKDEGQKREHKVIKIIDGRDKEEYKITEKHPGLGDGKKIPKDPRVNVGDIHWAHPHIVEKFVKAGWAERTDSDKKVFKMPQPPKK